MYDTSVLFGAFRLFGGRSKLEQTNDNYSRTCCASLAGIQPRKLFGNAA
jgi:hypothetical protein